MENYERVKIKGYLTILSDLHIGSGDESKLSHADIDAEGSLLTVLRGENDQPYIPASSLRGHLRAKAQTFLDSHIVDSLFGFTNDASRKTGKARVSNAFFSTSITPDQRHGIALDPVTSTVKPHMLYRQEVISANTQVELNLMLEQADSEELQALLGLLNQWDGGAYSSLGAMTGKGYGRVEWQVESIQALAKNDILKWLEEDGADKSLDSYYQMITPEVEATQANTNQVQFVLETQDPIVIHDPRRIDQQKKHAPKITCSRTNNNKALIPATSLKGLLRAWCRRIVMTILIQHYQQSIKEADDIADEVINDVFGTEGLSGYIRLSDAVSPDDLIKHIRPMIAIDRFSGGVKGGQYLSKEHEQRNEKEEKLAGALVNIEAALNSTYQGDISFHLTRKEPDGDSWKGLLVLALRDAMQGDFSVGWGKVRGFGSFKVNLQIEGENYDQWEDIYQKLVDDFSVNEWVTALHDRLEKSVTGKEKDI